MASITPTIVSGAPAATPTTGAASQASTISKVQKIALYTLATVLVVGAVATAVFFTGGAASPIIAWAPGTVPVVVTALEAIGPAVLGLAPLPFALLCGGVTYMLLSAVAATRKYFKKSKQNLLMTEAKNIVALALNGKHKNKNAILNVRKGATVDEINEAAKKLLKKFTATKAMSPSDKEVIEMARKAIEQARDLYLAKRKRTPPPLRERAATI